MFSDVLLDHFRNPRNAGDLEGPAVVVEVSNPACGDVMRLSLAVDQGRLSDARFKTRGCVAAIACGSALTELIKGKSIEEAERVLAADVSARVGGLPPESGHAAVLAHDALTAALKAAR